MKKLLLTLSILLSLNSFAGYFFTKGAPTWLNEESIQTLTGWDIHEDFSYLSEATEEIITYCRYTDKWDSTVVQDVIYNAEMKFSYSTLYNGSLKMGYVVVMVTPFYFYSNACMYKRSMKYVSIKGKDLTNQLTSSQYNWLMYNSPFSIR